MIPAGYMAKRVAVRPDWLDVGRVVDIYSVSGCVSPDFADWVSDWRHNGYWLFDSPEIIESVAEHHAVDLTGTALFYYEAHPQQFDENQHRWLPVVSEPSFTTQVVPPLARTLEGYDVVTFSAGTRAECSPLSCSRLAAEIETNAHCLLPTLERGRALLEAGRFGQSEPGPFRILAVYSVSWPVAAR
jgi:hypothetical protein